MEGFERRAGVLLAHWSRLVAARPRAVLVAVALATLAIAAYTATHLRINADQDAMFSDDLPHRVLEIEYHKIFPATYENVVIVIDAPTPERAGEAARALAERLRSAPEYFHGVYLPRGEFFERHALLYADLEQLEDFADRLARVQPYLAGLADDGTLRGLAMMLARGARAVRDGDVQGEELVTIYARVADAMDASREGRAASLSWAEVVAGRALDADERRRLVIAQPVLDFGQLAAARDSIEALRRFASELGLDEESGVRVRVTGDVALSYEEMDLVEDQAVLAGIASFVMVTSLLAYALRSLRLVVAIVVALLIGLVWTAGFAAFAVGHLNLISMTFAVLFIGLAADFSLHLCMRHQELVLLGKERRRALEESARGVGPSLVLCALTTTIGFFAFVPTDFAGVAELGLIAGTGLVIGLVVTLSVVPAVLMLGNGGAVRALRFARGAGLPTFPLRRPRAVAFAALAAAGIAVFALPEARFDQNPLRVRDPSAESVQTYEELLKDGATSPWGLSAVAADFDAAESLAAKLRGLPSVQDAETVRAFIPADQDEKLAILEDAALFLAPLSDGESRAAPTLGEQRDALLELEEELALLARDRAQAGDAELLAAAGRLRNAVSRFVAFAGSDARGRAAVDALEQSLVATLPGQLETLERALTAGPITYDDLPPELRDRMVSSDGQVRVRIFPRDELEDGDALARFVEEVRSVAPGATGNAINIYEASRAVVRALRQALVAAVLVIALLLVIIWRTVGDTLLVMAPLALAGLLTGAVAVLAGIPFNFADIIVLPLLLGIGVDSGIHLVHRARMGDVAHNRLMETSTARAVLFSALTTIASFGSLAFATHRGMANLGQLLTIGVLLTLLCNLTVLPAMIALRARAD